MGTPETEPIWARVILRLKLVLPLIRTVAFEPKRSYIQTWRPHSLELWALSQNVQTYALLMPQP